MRSSFFMTYFLKLANTHDLTSTHAHRHTVQNKEAEQFSSHGPCIHRRLTLHISVSSEKTGSVACYRKWHHRKLPPGTKGLSLIMVTNTYCYHFRWLLTRCVRCRCRARAAAVPKPCRPPPTARRRAAPRLFVCNLPVAKETTRVARCESKLRCVVCYSRSLLDYVYK